MQELFLSLKPRNLMLIWTGLFVLGGLTMFWSATNLAERGPVIGVAIFAAMFFSGGWHYSIGKFLTDKCQDDLGFFGRLYRPMAIFAACYAIAVILVWATYYNEIFGKGDQEIQSMMLYVLPAHLLATASGFAMLRIEAKALVALERDEVDADTDYKKTKRQLGSPFGMAKIQKRVQAIRDKDPMRVIYSADRPDLTS